MFQEIESRIAGLLEARLQESFGIQARVLLEEPKQSSFGELATPVAFQLARQLKRPPRQIAEELAAGLTDVPGLASCEIAGNGYINVRLERGAYAQSLLEPEPEPSHSPGKIVVEHTNINPNKAAHIGHLRNAVLGDTFVRILRKRGRHVEVQNYIDNTGVQVADVVAAFHYLERKTPSEVARLIEDPNVRFDYLCWDLYARISAHYKEDPSALAWRTETLHQIEAGEGALSEVGHLVADAIVNLHLRTMSRVGVRYQLLPRESEILHLNFWRQAFEILKQRHAIYFETTGKNAGCWVMPASAFRLKNAVAGEPEEAEANKVIVRSNGTVTYVGKDIAYQLWKFGLLGKDFFYRRWWTYADGQQVWATSDRPVEDEVPSFGHALQVFNVIDSRQSYLQDVVVAGLRALSFDAAADASTHFSYEMVALSPRTCIDLGIPISEEDRSRAYVEVSGRKGLGVKADDLIDKLIEAALREVVDRHPAEPRADLEKVATQIAVGALRYFMLKFTRNSVIAFDMSEALSFEGETGPYIQYTSVRATNILRKYEETGRAIPEFRSGLSHEDLRQLLSEESLWQLLLLASKSTAALDRAVSSGEPAHVAKYAFQLAQAFNNFYHEHSVINEPNDQRRIALLWLTNYVRDQLVLTMHVLGIEQPAYM